MIEHSELIEKLLGLLRRWGWEAGAAKLRAELGTNASDAGPEVEGFFQGWLAAERGEYDAAETHGRALADSPALAGWAHFVRGFVAMRRKQYATALRLLDEAAAAAGPDDPTLAVAVLHVRGTVLFHQGKSRDALRLLNQARRQLAETHFAFGRVLDAAGMVYGSLGNFDAARAFFRRSLEHKESHDDRAGQALTHGQLGRLHLEWGLLDVAEHHFKRDRALCEQTDDQRGRVQMSNALGQVALARGDWGVAGQWLDSALRECRGRSGWEVIEGYAHKDRALAYLAGGAVPGPGAPSGGVSDLAKAEDHLRAAERLFRGLPEPFGEGLAHVNRAWGALLRLGGRWDDARQRLRDALAHFQKHRELVEVTSTQLELARVDRAAGETGEPAVDAVRIALATAEESRRPEAVRRAERELREVSPADYYARLHERARGRGADADPTSLITGVRTSGTVLFLDVKNSSLFGRGHGPATVMLTINQLMAHVSEALRRHDGRINDFAGDGFLARFLGDEHARHAVEAGLEMNEAVREFNEPRDALGLPPFEVRIGISTGELCLGNVGTYDKLVFASLGSTTNLGARLESNAEVGRPCISQVTHEQVGGRFEYVDPAGREIEAKGFGKVRVWDVARRKL